MLLIGVFRKPYPFISQRHFAYNPGMITPSNKPSIVPVPQVVKTKRRTKPKMFNDKELQAIGAAVWAALVEDTDTLHARFFPSGKDGSPISKEELLVKLYSTMGKLRKLGVDMG